MATAEPRELRIALSMNGGVSLAVWIGGAVCEIDRLRGTGGATPFWTALLDACGYLPAARIDVMTGASAGGLNAVLLAQSIRCDRPFADFQGLWEEHADINRLVKGPKGSTRPDNDPRGLLDGQYFRTQVLATLRQTRSTEGELSSLSQFEQTGADDLALFASATLVEPIPVSYTDAPGEPIHEARSDAYFHLARRGKRSAARGLDGFTIPHVEEALADIGRSTSSLPGLFEPQPFRRSAATSNRTGGDAAHPSQSWLVGAYTLDRDQVDVMDGGVVDNVPIARAIRAIHASSTTVNVRRVLLYLHPDPSTGSKPMPPPQTARQVVRSFFGKRAESLREDIDLLREHNASVAVRAATTRALLSAAAAAFDDPAAPVVSRTADAAQAEVAMLMRAASDPASVIAWNAPAEPAVVPLLDSTMSMSRRRLEREITAEFATSPGVLLAERHRRAAASIEQLLWMAVHGGTPSNALARALERASETQLLAELVTSYQLSRFLGSPDDPAAGLRRAKSDLDAFTVANPLDDDDWRRIAGWQVSAGPNGPARRTLVDALDESVHELIEVLPDALPEPVLTAGRATDDVADDGALARRILLAVKAQPARLDLVVDALLPVHADPTTSVQHIDFFRVAGNAPSPAAAEFAKHVAAANRGNKVAGRQLNHLGAFFDTTWRTNDWQWGQLDAVPTLLDAILDATALEALRTRLASDAGVRAELGVAAEDLAPERLEQLRDSLVRCRQGQLVQRYFDLADADFTRAAASPQFIDWAKTDRRLLTKLGRQDLTGVGMRGVLTATNAIKHRLKWWWCIAIEVLVRPVLMGVSGLFLTGRWGMASLAWTVGGLAVPRASSAFSRWALWSVALLLVALVLWFTERKQKLPDRGGVRGIVPFVLTGAALAVSTSMFWPGVRTGLARPRSWLPEDLPLSVPLAGAAAAIAAGCISWWMRRRAWCTFTVVVFAWYALFARASERAAAGHHDWTTWGPLRQVWVAWLVAIVAAPFVFAHLSTGALGGPDKLGVPDKPAADLASAARAGAVGRRPRSLP